MLNVATTDTSAKRSEPTTTPRRSRDETSSPRRARAEPGSARRRPPAKEGRRSSKPVRKAARPIRVMEMSLAAMGPGETWRAVNYSPNDVQSIVFWFEPDIVCFLSFSDMVLAKRKRHTPFTYAVALLKQALEGDTFAEIGLRDMLKHAQYGRDREDEFRRAEKRRRKLRRWVDRELKEHREAVLERTVLS